MRQTYESFYLLTCTTVDALAQQIGVADVSRVLLDQVHDDVAGFHYVAVALDGVVEVEGCVDLLSVGDLTAPRRLRVSDNRVVGYCLLKSKSGSSPVR